MPKLIKEYYVCTACYDKKNGGGCRVEVTLDEGHDKLTGCIVGSNEVNPSAKWVRRPLKTKEIKNTAPNKAMVQLLCDCRSAIEVAIYSEDGLDGSVGEDLIGCINVAVAQQNQAKKELKEVNSSTSPNKRSIKSCDIEQLYKLVFPNAKVNWC